MKLFKIILFVVIGIAMASCSKSSEYYVKYTVYFEGKYTKGINEPVYHLITENGTIKYENENRIWSYTAGPFEAGSEVGISMSIPENELTTIMHPSAYATIEISKDNGPFVNKAKSDSGSSFDLKYTIR